MMKMTKAAWIRLSILLLIFAGILAAAWFFYLETIERPEDEWLYYYVWYSGLARDLQEYDSLRFHPEYESFKARVSPDGSLDRAIQSLRDLKDSLNADKMYEEIKPTDDTRFDLMSLNYFVDEFFEHIKITDDEIIGVEDLTEQELHWIKNDDRFRQMAALVAAQMIYERNQGYGFLLFHEGIFDFEETVFTEFIQTEKYFDTEKREYVYHFSIKTEDGRGLVIGDMSGEEWVFRVSANLSAYRHFLPADFELIELIEPPYSELNGMSNFVNICVNHAAYFYSAASPSYAHLVVALFFPYPEINDEDYILSPEDFREKVEYVLGITIPADTDLSSISWSDEQIVPPNRLSSHTKTWLYAELVFEEHYEEGGEVIINYYGDGFYYELAKTIRYEYEADETSWWLALYEVLFESEEVEIATRWW
jgi:hypothetical protein